MTDGTIVERPESCTCGLTGGCEICNPSVKNYPKDEIEAANKRAAARLAKTPTAVRARYDRRSGRVVIDLSTGFSIMFKPHAAQDLKEAKPEQLAKIEISPSGFGIYFPDLDADLYLPGLLEGFRGSQRWMASQLGKTGGRFSDSKGK